VPFQPRLLFLSDCLFGVDLGLNLLLDGFSCYLVTCDRLSWLLISILAHIKHFIIMSYHVTPVFLSSVAIDMLLCSVFVYLTVTGRKCEINLNVI